MDSEECADIVTLAENSKSLCTQVIIKGDVDGIYTSRPVGVALTLARRIFHGVVIICRMNLEKSSLMHISVEHFYQKTTNNWM